MGIESGNYIGSTSGSFFDSSNNLNSNCSVKSREGTSSSSSSNHYYYQKQNEIRNEREKILNSKIEEIKIGIEPIGPKTAHKIVNNAVVSRIRNFCLPAYFGGGTFCHHLSCLLRTEAIGYIIFEYGGYYGGEPNYKNYIHYWDQDGLRFSKMTYDDYQEKLKNAGSNYSILDVIFDNKITVGELIQKCCINGKWRAYDYNLSTNNCQDFIAKVIEVLIVKRKYSCKYSSALVTIPPCILRALEKNEGRETLRFFQKLPYLGKIVDIGAGCCDFVDEMGDEINKMGDKIIKNRNSKKKNEFLNKIIKDKIIFK